jgi:hypothetical protein
MHGFLMFDVVLLRTRPRFGGVLSSIQQPLKLAELLC